MRLGASAALTTAAILTAAILAGACGETRGTLVKTGSPAPTPWRPSIGISWQVQLTGTLDTSVNVALYEVDLFDTAPAAMDLLHAAGRRVICYLSAGTLESWRSDVAAFPPTAVGNAVAGYPMERWLDTRAAAARSAMALRLDLARSKGCDGVDLSNLSPGGADSGFALASTDTLAYASFLTGEAHTRGLSAGLGGGDDVAPDLVPAFEWAFTEGCLGAGTCGAFAGFVAAHKVVFAVEFGTAADAASTCPLAQQASLDALIKNRTYDDFRVACP